jgi:hypothetical protein
MDRYVLCRRDLADIGAEPRYCCKEINTPNALNWCDGCHQRLPLWPTEDSRPVGVLKARTAVGV